ncbi:hypothetical protein Pmani_031551 [Petrolisthes manimaculis]|uniref:Centromere/kinetochore protein zw10 n=1 Tax=Petrolisthes manimaculis TaxID=1843537 RepID=A0AAE1NVF4_9EUCA|nr:hypothetical protein Pmani_031551 [Petrolisthes manimaculis]
MSLVSEVLASFRGRGREHCVSPGVDEGQLEEIVRQAEEAREAVLNSLATHYSHLNTAVHDTNYLHDRVGKARTNVSGLSDYIEQEVLRGVKGSVGEVGGVVRRWKEVVVGLEAVNIILDIHTLLDQTHKAQLNHNYINAANSLATVDGLVKAALEKEVEGELDIIHTLKEEILVRRTQLLYTISEVWSETVTWEETKTDDGVRAVMLTVRTGGVSGQGGGKITTTTTTSSLQEMVSASFQLGELQRHIAALANNIMKHLLQPLMKAGCKVTITQHNDGISIQCCKSSSSSSPPSDPDTQTSNNAAQAMKILDNLQEVFEVLHRTVLCVKVNSEEEEEGKQHDNNNTTLMHMLGKEIGEDFKCVLIRDCLAEAVPYSRAQLDQYEQVKQAAERFQRFLIEKGFFSESEQSLLEYAANVDVVFSNKACAYILDQARQLMKRPLHVTLYITTTTHQQHNNEQTWVIQDETERVMEKSTMRLEKLLAAKSLNLPKCQISSSVCELVELIYDTLDEACHSSALYAGRLFYTVRNILTLYCHVVPTAHAHELATLPQQAAVVHNNSMYLAHHAIFLGHQYRLRLPKALRDSTLTTVDLAQQLRTMATTTFLTALHTHRTTLIHTLRETALVSGVDSIGSDSTGTGVSVAHQGMRQVLHQLQLLHKVWQNVLPHTVYTKAIGTLVGSVVEEVIARVVVLEDISADSALALINILNLLHDFVPSLFKVDGDDNDETSRGDVVRVVRLWSKFSELIVVLGASLRDIMDRWAEGKGPLAHEFTPDEAKQLVRALFQNTDRRAHVLARIK